MGSTFGQPTDPASGSGAIDSVIRSKFNHLKEVLARLLVNHSPDSDLCTLRHEIELPPGLCIMWPGPNILPGYIDGNGVPQLRATHPRMYQNYRNPNTGLDTWPGGNGVTTFGIPNCYARSPMAAGPGPGLVNRILGSVGGAELVALTGAHNGPHDHPGSFYMHGAGFTSLGEGTHPAVIIGATGPSGSGVPHENLHPVIVFRFLLKAG